MSNKKSTSPQWILLPILFSSASVLAGGLNDLDDHALRAVDQATALSADSDGFLDDTHASGSASMGYVGGNTRIGVGFDNNFNGRVEGSHIFSASDDAATSAQGWIGINPEADSDKNEEMITGAGAKVNHHWVSGDGAGGASHVNKVFGAYDQNEAADKKFTAGYGQERENMFWSGHVSKSMSDKRVSGKTSDGKHIYEKAYDYGVGGRVGAFVDGSLLRIQGGLDYEWGSEHAESEDMPAQLTVSGGVEKFFHDSPHSIGANLGVSTKTGGYEGVEHEADVSGNVSYRYDFGNAGMFASDEQYRRVRVEIPGKTEARAPVRHNMAMDAETFFNYNTSQLTPAGQQRLLAMLMRIRNANYKGQIRVIGDACACDDGAQYDRNALSRQRAAEVKRFMVQNGFTASEIRAFGFNELGGQFVSAGEDRVVIQYMTQDGQAAQVSSQPRVAWRKELIQSGPAWVGQALRNNATHKQSIDTYQTLGAGAMGGGAANMAPVAVNDNVQTAFETAVMIDVLANDTDVNTGDTLTVTSYDASTPNQGMIKLEDGKLIYTPAKGFSGTDTFKYTISDGKNTSMATVTVVVAKAANVAPVAMDDKVSTAFDTQVTINALNNDSDADGDTLSITAFDAQSVNGGTVTQQNGMFIYTPKAGFSGTDTFTYTISDGQGNEAKATVSVHVAEEVTKPGLAAANDSVTTPFNTAVSIDVLANDSDAHGDTIAIDAFDTSTSNSGSIASVNGMLVYTPAAGFTGTDTFNYTITDNNGEKASATVTVTVETQALKVVDDGTQGEMVGDAYSFYTNDAMTRNLDVMANDMGDELTIVAITVPPRFGTAVISSDGKSINYTLRSGYCEDHFFVYRVRDKHGNEAEARSYINVLDDGKASADRMF